MFPLEAPVLANVHPQLMWRKVSSLWRWVLLNIDGYEHFFELFQVSSQPEDKLRELSDHFLLRKWSADSL